MTDSVLSRLTAASALVMICASTVAAQSTPRSEYEIKAAYLFSFGRFVDWPPRPGRDQSPFTICVLGTDPFGPALDTTLAGATIRGRRPPLLTRLFILMAGAVIYRRHWPQSQRT